LKGIESVHRIGQALEVAMNEIKRERESDLKEQEQR
jgi:hypothetical protein